MTGGIFVGLKLVKCYKRPGRLQQGRSHDAHEAMGVMPVRASMAGSSSKESCSSWATFTETLSLP